MRVAVTYGKQPRTRRKQARPEWNSMLTDPDRFKLTEREMEIRKELRVRHTLGVATPTPHPRFRVIHVRARYTSGVEAQHFARA